VDGALTAGPGRRGLQFSGGSSQRLREADMQAHTVWSATSSPRHSVPPRESRCCSLSQTRPPARSTSPWLTAHPPGALGRPAGPGTVMDLDQRAAGCGSAARSDSKNSPGLRCRVSGACIEVIKTPPQAPHANAFLRAVGGTIPPRMHRPGVSSSASVTGEGLRRVRGHYKPPSTSSTRPEPPQPVAAHVIDLKAAGSTTAISAGSSPSCEAA